MLDGKTVAVPAGATIGACLGFIALLVTSLFLLSFGMWLDVADNEKPQR